MGDNYNVYCHLTGTAAGPADPGVVVTNVLADTERRAMADVAARLRREDLDDALIVSGAMLRLPLPVPGDHPADEAGLRIHANGWLNARADKYFAVLRQSLERQRLTEFVDATDYLSRLAYLRESMDGMEGEPLLETRTPAGVAVDPSQLDLAITTESLAQEWWASTSAAKATGTMVRTYLERLAKSPVGKSPWPLRRGPHAHPRTVAWQCPVCARPVCASVPADSEADELLERHRAGHRPLFCRVTACTLGPLTVTASVQLTVEYGVPPGQAVIAVDGLRCERLKLPVGLAARVWDAEQRRRGGTLFSRSDPHVSTRVWTARPQPAGSHYMIHRAEGEQVEGAARLATELQERRMDFVRLVMARGAVGNVPQWPGMIRDAIWNDVRPDSGDPGVAVMRVPDGTPAHTLGFRVDHLAADGSYCDGNGLNYWLFTDPSDDEAMERGGAGLPVLLKTPADYLAVVESALRGLSKLPIEVWQPAETPEPYRARLLMLVDGAWDLRDAHRIIGRAVAAAQSRERPAILTPAGRGVATRIPTQLHVFARWLPIAVWLGDSSGRHTEKVTDALLDWLQLPHPEQVAGGLLHVRPKRPGPTRGLFQVSGVEWGRLRRSLPLGVLGHPHSARFAAAFQRVAELAEVPRRFDPMMALITATIASVYVRDPALEKGARPRRPGVLREVTRLPISLRRPSGAPRHEPDPLAAALPPNSFPGAPPRDTWPDELPTSAADVADPSLRVRFQLAGQAASSARGGTSFPTLDAIAGMTPGELRMEVTDAVNGRGSYALSHRTPLEDVLLLPLLNDAHRRYGERAVPADARAFVTPAQGKTDGGLAYELWDAICAAEEADDEAKPLLRVAACMAVAGRNSPAVLAILLAGAHERSSRVIRAGQFDLDSVLGHYLQDGLADGAEFAAQCVYAIRNSPFLVGHDVLYNLTDRVIQDFSHAAMRVRRVRQLSELVSFASENDAALAALVSSYFDPEDAISELQTEEARGALGLDTLVELARRPSVGCTAAMEELNAGRDPVAVRQIDHWRREMCKKPDHRAVGVELVVFPHSVQASRLALYNSTRADGHTAALCASLQAMRAGLATPGIFAAGVGSGGSGPAAAADGTGAAYPNSALARLSRLSNQ